MSEHEPRVGQRWRDRGTGDLWTIESPDGEDAWTLASFASSNSFRRVRGKELATYYDLDTLSPAELDEAVDVHSAACAALGVLYTGAVNVPANARVSGVSTVAADGAPLEAEPYDGGVRWRSRIEEAAARVAELQERWTAARAEADRASEVADAATAESTRLYQAARGLGEALGVAEKRLARVARGLDADARCPYCKGWIHAGRCEQCSYVGSGQMVIG